MWTTEQPSKVHGGVVEFNSWSGGLAKSTQVGGLTTCDQLQHYFSIQLFREMNRQQTLNWELQLEIHSNVSTEERMARETFSSIQWAKLIIPHKLIFCHHLLTLTSHLLFHARKKVNGDRICLFSEQICINVRILGYFTSITRLQTSGKKTIHMYTHKCL